MAKVSQMRLIKQKLGKYSKVMGYDESMLDEVIEVQPEEETVKDDIKTAALEVMDVVDIPKKNGESEEVVVIETPKMDDTTVKVQSTETGVTADIPVEAFSKAVKISKAKIKAYSEAKEAEAKAEAEAKEEKPAEEAKPEEKSAEESKPEGELETKSEGEEAKPEESKPESEESKPEEKKEGEEVAELETKSLSISLADGTVYAYSCEGECDEIINEDGELDTVVPLDKYCGTEATYAKGRNILQKIQDKVMGRNAKTMEGLAHLGISRETAKKLEKSTGKFAKIGVGALVSAGLAKKFLNDVAKVVYKEAPGVAGSVADVAEKAKKVDELIKAVNPRDPEDVKKVMSKVQRDASAMGVSDKVAEVKQEYKDKLAAASNVMVYSRFKYAGAPIALGVYSEETNEIVEKAQENAEEAKADKAEAAAEVAENAAEVKQPEGTNKLPIVIEKVDNGYNVTANGETKVADDVKSVCNIVSELLEETKMDTFSKMSDTFRNYL